MQTVMEALRVSSIAYPTIFLATAIFWILIVLLRKIGPKGED
jgi:hypothetical protein